MAEYLYLESDLDVVRGHVSREEAAEAVRRETGWPQPSDRYIAEHCYARLVPAPPGYPYDLSFYFSEPGCGAFQVTVVKPVGSGEG